MPPMCSFPFPKDTHGRARGIFVEKKSTALGVMHGRKRKPKSENKAIVQCLNPFCAVVPSRRSSRSTASQVSAILRLYPASPTSNPRENTWKNFETRISSRNPPPSTQPASTPIDNLAKMNFFHTRIRFMKKLSCAQRVNGLKNAL